MSDFVKFVILGIPAGCVFALMAMGLVLTYKTSGVFNLAFGAQAFVSAAVFYVLRAQHDWPTWLAFLVAVAAVGPALGWVLDHALYRHLRTASSLAKLVTSLGLLVAIPQIVKLDFLLGPDEKLRPPGIATETTYSFGDWVLSGNEIAAVVFAVASVLGIMAMFRWTTVGLRMRAVVESPRMTELNGVNAPRVGSAAWMLSSFFAGLAGVLISPLFASLNEMNFFTLLVAALAAAALGRLVSIPVAFLGGVGLGVAQALLAGYLPQNNVLSTGLRPALPFVVLFLVLLFMPGLRDARETTDPLAGVDPPPPAPAAAIRSRGLTIANRVVAIGALVVILVLALFVVDAYWLRLMIVGSIFALIFLSFTIITGLGGQISLCQATFAAVGAFTTAQLVSRTGMSVLAAMVIGALVAAVVGTVIALPALRLGGIYLALATLAFALMFENILRPLDWVSGGTKPPRVPRPLVFGIDFANTPSGNRAFLVLCAVLLVLVAVPVLLIKYGTTGRFLDALRGSEAAAASIGISPARSKFIAFAISAGIAGFGGGLLASFEGRVNFETNYVYYLGLVWIVLVITLGARSIQAAIFAGLSLTLFPALLTLLLGKVPFVGEDNVQTLANSIAYIGFGLGALTYAKHPEGIIEAQTRRSIEKVQGLLARRGDGGASTDSTGEPAPAVAGAGAGGDS